MTERVEPELDHADMVTPRCPASHRGQLPVVQPPKLGSNVPDMSSSPRNALASAIGWVIVGLVAIWAFGMLIGWIHFVLRTFAWIVLIALLTTAYFAVRRPPDP
jgi:hypothetical protein